MRQPSARVRPARTYGDDPPLSYANSIVVGNPLRAFAVHEA